MQVIIENEQKEVKVEPGDILVTENGFVHIVTQLEINRNKGLNGICLDGYLWADDAQKYVDDGICTLYKSTDYELVLRKKVR